MEQQFSVIITTTATKVEADKLARLLLSQQLAACIQVSQITSYYTWNEAVNVDDEQLLIIKCPKVNFSAIERCIKDNHSYEIPEIVQLPIEAGSAEYLQWIDRVTRSVVD
jgi:periplasmic divalent cation tolerance protein